jgi:hypothetical protein
MTSGFRFDPPRVQLSCELGWVLARAFGPVSVSSESMSGLGGELALEIAERLDLAERIAARTPSGVISAVLGETAAAGFQRAHTGCVARSLVVERVAGEVAGIAADLGVPLVFLKGAALQLGGWIEPGSRSMGDVDVLVPDESARRFEDALIAAGCDSPEAPEAEHQLQLLTHPTGLGVEVHRLIPGVRLDGGSSATAEQVIERGLCRSIEALPGKSFVPDQQILAAHVLVHGLAQHGLSPDNYPWSRVLADVQDLGHEAADGLEILGSVMPWIKRDVGLEEIEAVLELMDRLGGGEDPMEIAAGDDRPAAILHHLVAGALDDEYVQSMRLARRTQHFSDQPRWRRLAVEVWRTVWLTRPQVDKLYGVPKSALGYWGWRLWRPFDLVGRAWRYGVAALRHRGRRR